MALTLLVANNAQSVLTAGISATATTLNVNTGTGGLFPQPVPDASFFKITLIDAATGQLTEVMHVTARTGDTMTIQRAQEGTVARAWSANDLVANMMTAGTLRYILDNFQPLDATLTALARRTLLSATGSNFYSDDARKTSHLYVNADGTAGAWDDVNNRALPLIVAPATQSGHSVPLAQVPSLVSGVVGTTRNLAMNVTAASTTATITADEIIVETALGGGQYRIASFNKQINLATTGAGGMDTGTVPANGFVGIYAIYNPVTGASALLAVNASAVIGEVYGGNNMPAGYTASALLTVVPTASSQFKTFIVQDRKVGIPIGTILTTSSSLSDSQMSFNGLAPINASYLDGIISLNGDKSGSLSVTLASTSNRIGPRQYGGYSVANTGLSASFQDIKIITKGSLFFSSANATSGNAAFIIYCTGYSI